MINAQAALEIAAASLIRSELGYGEMTGAAQCRRMADDRPPPLAPRVFLAVWSKGGRSSESRTALDERLGLSVTATVQLPGLPRDRWLAARDELLSRLDAVRALLAADSLDWRVIRPASVIRAGGADPAPVGFCEALAFAGYDAWRYETGRWFASDATEEVAIVQTANFARARLMQAFGTAV